MLGSSSAQKSSNHWYQLSMVVVWHGAVIVGTRYQRSWCADLQSVTGLLLADDIIVPGPDCCHTAARLQSLIIKTPDLIHEKVEWDGTVKDVLGGTIMRWDLGGQPPPPPHMVVIGCNGGMYSDDECQAACQAKQAMLMKVQLRACCVVCRHQCVVSAAAPRHCFALIGGSH